MTTEMISRMIKSDFSEEKGRIIFKYYGDFEELSFIYEDCKNELFYIGNSNKDGSPILEYYYNNINTNVLKNFNNLNVLLRNIKLKKYRKLKMTDKEKSLFTFFKFFMNACDNYQVKGYVDSELGKKYAYDD